MNQAVVKRVLLDRSNESAPQRSVLLGNRVPKDYFVTCGSGESDITIHAGSYHLALKEAGIEMCNIMTYSSILPAIANEVEKPDPKDLVHGSVMDTICAVANAERGERATAAIIYGWLFDRETGERFGGLVCEYHGEKTEADAAAELRMSLNELYFNGFSNRFELQEGRLTTKSIVPKKKYGTAIVSICFTSYECPVLA